MMDCKGVWCRNPVFPQYRYSRSQDINNETDWKLAEMKYRMMVQG
jgi:hypothetical protein